MINGKIVAAAPEERFNRIKMSTSFPFKAIEWCLKKNLKLKDMDLITVPWDPAININSASSRWTNDVGGEEMLSNIPINLMKILDDQPSNYMKLSFNDLEVNYLNHHECHAASAFSLSF